MQQMVRSVLPTGGIPLGIADTIDAMDWSFTIPPGAYLAFYTDGLIEHSKDVIAGEEQLLDAMREEIVDRAAAPALSLMRRVFGERKNSDDAAALFVATNDAPRTDFSFDFSAIPLAVPIVRRTLNRYATRLGLDDDRSYALITAVGEAMANAVEHAYPERPGIVRLRVINRGGALHATIEDDGRWKQAQKRDERGRGLPLMRALMDGVEIRAQRFGEEAIAQRTHRLFGLAAAGRVRRTNGAVFVEFAHLGTLRAASRSRLPAVGTRYEPSPDESPRTPPRQPACRSRQMEHERAVPARIFSVYSPSGAVTLKCRRRGRVGNGDRRWLCKCRARRL